MARTIMVSDRVYAELKKLKGNDKSFSEVILEGIEAAKPRKTMAGLLKFAGVFEGDTEYDEAFKWLKKAQKISNDRLWKESH